jgi:hypothetical protein
MGYILSPFQGFNFQGFNFRPFQGFTHS